MGWMIVPYLRAFDFSGRSRRMEYWMFQLLSTIIACIALIFFVSSMPLDGASDPEVGIGFLFGSALIFVFGISAFFPTLSVTVRRLHDQNLSGWMLLTAFIPVVGGLILFIFMIRPGTRGPNRFGSDPRARDLNNIFA